MTEFDEPPAIKEHVVLQRAAAKMTRLGVDNVAFVLSPLRMRALARVLYACINKKNAMPEIAGLWDVVEELAARISTLDTNWHAARKVLTDKGSKAKDD